MALIYFKESNLKDFLNAIFEIIPFRRFIRCLRIRKEQFIFAIFSSHSYSFFVTTEKKIGSK